MLRPTLESAVAHGSRSLVPAAPDTPRPPDTPTAPDTPASPVSSRARVVVDHRDDPAVRRVFSRAILGGGPGLR